jgi:hypothetical protein
MLLRGMIQEKGHKNSLMDLMSSIQQKIVKLIQRRFKIF